MSEYVQHFLLGEEYMGSRKRHKHWVKNSLVPPAGYAFFCPHCSELWFLAPVEGEESMVWTIPCEKHEPDVIHVPGSVWLEWDKDWQQALPAAVLEREVYLHLQYARWCGLNTRVLSGELNVIS